MLEGSEGSAGQILLISYASFSFFEKQGAVPVGSGSPAVRYIPD
jgi:hypothetical protein